MALRLVVAHSPAERSAARAVEAHVFLQAFANTPDMMVREYGPYEDRSRFITIIDDADGSALGTARLIIADDVAPVKTLLDVAGDPWRLDVADSLAAAGLLGQPVWDVASLAVHPRHRAGSSGAEVSLALCHGIWRYARNCGVPGMVTILDDRVLRLVRAMGLPWFPMVGATSRFYLGSPASTPCVFAVESAEDHVRAVRPDLADALVHGAFRSIVLDPADLLPTRGSLVCEAPPLDRQAPSPPLRRDVAGWRPAASSRSEFLANSSSRPA